MRTSDALTTSLLICGGVFPTTTSFHIKPSSWTKTSTRPISPDFASRPTATPQERCLGNSSRAQPRRPRHSRSCVSGIAARQQHIVGDLEGLSRSQLQALCKELGVRAVGKTSELLLRLQDHQQHQQSLETIAPAASPPDEISPSSSSFSTPIADDLPVEAVPMGVSSTASSVASDATDLFTRALVEEPLTAVDGDASLLRPLPVDFGSSLTAGSGNEHEAPELLLSDEDRSVFDDLSGQQWVQVEELGQLLTEWNGKVNLISRKDIANVMRRHVVPCLAMAKALDLEDGAEVLDVGTGGGLPGLPLAIYYPNVRFTLVDGTGKKIAAVKDMVQRLGLTNVRAFHIRAEEVHETFDFVIGRAVTALPKFVGFIEKNLKRNAPSSGRNGARTNPGAPSSSNSPEQEEEAAPLKYGVLYMRGEVTAEELAELGAQPSTVISLQRVMEGGGSGDAGSGVVEEGVADRGYSSVFHFTSEAIWGRTPLVASSSAEEDRE